MTWTCADCTAVYAVGLRACPQCRSERIVREDNGMPKITVHGGPSFAPTEEGEQPSPGTSSSTSPEPSPKKSAPSKHSRPRRARTTANRSKQAPTGSSSASSTDGGQTAPTSPAPAAD